MAIESYCQDSKLCQAEAIFNLDKQTINQLINIYNWIQVHMFMPINQLHDKDLLGEYKNLAAKSGGGIFINQMIHNINQVINKKNKQKQYVLYVDHDGPMSVILGYLIVYNDAFLQNDKLNLIKKIDFGADLSFQLYQKENQYNVLVTYKDSYDQANEVILYKGSFKKFKSLYYRKSYDQIIKENLCSYF